jgi:hypothetical protein
MPGEVRARKYDVPPLDNSTLARWNTPRPSLTAGKTTFTYSGELSGVPGSAAPDTLGKSYTITAEVESAATSRPPTTVPFLGAKMPKLVKIAVSQIDPSVI